MRPILLGYTLHISCLRESLPTPLQHLFHRLTNGTNLGSNHSFRHYRQVPMLWTLIVCSLKVVASALLRDILHLPRVPHYSARRSLDIALGTELPSPPFILPAVMKEFLNGRVNDGDGDGDDDGDAFESLEIERNLFCRQQWWDRRRGQYATMLVLVATFLTWQVLVDRSEILSCTTGSGGFCDVKTTTTNADLFVYQTNAPSETRTATPTASPSIDLDSSKNKSKPPTSTQRTENSFQNNTSAVDKHVTATETSTANPTASPSIDVDSSNNSQPPTTQMMTANLSQEPTSSQRGTDDNNKDSGSHDPTKSPEIPIVDRASQDAKYVLYFSESGWANQEIGLEHAFYIARALNRTLILPPVLPHLGKGNTIPRDVFGMDSGNFKTWVDPLKFYVKKLPSNKYLPISKILDRDYSFADVSTIDAKEFSSIEGSKTMSRWVMEYNYSHFNTKWIYNSPELEGTVTTQTRTEYGKARILNLTLRDIAVEFKDSPEDTLVLLDGFKSIFDKSAMHPPFQPRMSTSIREAAYAVRDRWNVPAYAAVHIRGGDGNFQKEEKLKESIRTAMDHISLQVTAWLGSHSDEIDAVGLYVATDVENLFNHPVMTHEIEELVDGIRKSGNTTIEILWGKDILNETNLLGDLRYANVFMDIQMAACATIGYIGTEGSTFSRLIQDHRHENSC